jgi:hypothetical protein
MRQAVARVIEKLRALIAEAYATEHVTMAHALESIIEELVDDDNRIVDDVMTE